MIRLSMYFLIKISHLAFISFWSIVKLVLMHLSLHVLTTVTYFWRTYQPPPPLFLCNKYNAHLVYCYNIYTQITPILCYIYQLFIKCCTHFKIFLIPFKAHKIAHLPPTCLSYYSFSAKALFSLRLPSSTPPFFLPSL